MSCQAGLRAQPFGPTRKEGFDGPLWHSLQGRSPCVSRTLVSGAMVSVAGGLVEARFVVDVEVIVSDGRGDKAATHPNKSDKIKGA